MDTRRAQNAEAKDGAPSQNRLPNTHWIPAALDQMIHQPSPDKQIASRRESPGDAGVDNGMQQVHVKAGRKITGQPGQQKIKSVVVGSKSKCEAVDFPIPQQITEWRSGSGNASALGLRSTARNELPLHV